MVAAAGDCLLAQRVPGDLALACRALTQHAPDWDDWRGPDGRYIYVSPACEAVCGHSPEDFLADPDLMSRLLHPDDRGAWEQHLRDALVPEGGLERHQRMELRLMSPDGSVRWIEHQCQPAFDQVGGFLGRRGVNHDITPLKEAQAALERSRRFYTTLTAFNQALPRASDVPSLCLDLCRIVVEEGGARACVLSLAGTESNTLVPVAQAGLAPGLAERMPLSLDGTTGGLVPPVRLWTQGCGTVCSDCGGDSLDPAWRVWASDAGVHACYHELVHRGGRPAGVMSCFATGADDFQPGLVGLLQELAKDLSFGLDSLDQRGRERISLEALARSERHLHALVDAAPVGVAVVGEAVEDLADVDGARARPDPIIRELNQFLCDLVGYPREALIGRSTRLLFPSDEEHQRIWRDLYPRVTQEGHARIDTVLRRQDGQRVEVVLSVAALDRRDPSLGLIYTLLDVSEAKRAHALLEARVTLAAVAAGADLDALRRTTLDAAERLTGSQVGFFHLVDSDQEHLTLHTWSTDTIPACAAQPRHHSPVSEAGVWADCIRRRLPVIHNAYLELVHRQGLPDGHVPLVRELTVPVERGGLVVAVLGVGNKPVDYTQDDLAAVVQLADMAMGLVDTLNADAALREANARLLEAQALARVGHWRLEADQGRFEWSPQVYEIFGLDPARPPPDLEALCRLFHPQDLPGFQSDLARVLAEGASFERDARVIHTDLGLRHIHILGQGDADESDRISALHGTIQDISERKRAEAELAQARQGLELALDGGDMGLYDGDLATGRVRLDERYLGILGYVPGEIEATLDAWRELVHPHDRPRILAAMQGLSPQTGDRVELEYRMRHKSGRWVWILDRSRVFEWDAQGRPRRIAGSQLDITSRKESEERLRQSARVFESTSEGVIITDAGGTILAVNRAFTDITGYAESEALGHNARLLKSGRHEREFYSQMWTQLGELGQWRGEIWNRRKNGDLYPEWLTISAVQDPSGQVSHYVAVFSDITAIKRSQDHLDYLAHHDALTGLPNRVLLRDRLAQAIARARRDSRRLALLFLDLDGFKGVNDSLGHAVGDALLVEVARRMRERLRASDTLARLGGDEFLILLEDEPQIADEAMVANALLALIARPVLVDGQEIAVSASIGISQFPADGQDADSLLRSADLAMYRAKAAGRNGYQFYTPEMTAQARERHALENALRGALDRGEFHLHYQPQVEIAARRLVGVEALVRWHHPSLGLVPPRLFIPVAEEIGILAEIGDWALESACRQLVEWRALGFRVPRLAVHVSMQQLERESQLGLVTQVLEQAGLSPEDLELEVTESMISGRSLGAKATLDALRCLGVSLAVDDFGTGYSALGRLNRMPIDRLKIDASFVRDIANDIKGEAIARAIIGLGRDLGLEVIAEGVEREEQAAFLVREGCAQAQGHLFGQPSSAGDLQRRWAGERSGR